MDVPLVLTVLGGLFIVLGLAGGGIKTKWVEVPARLGRGIRLASVAFGIVCVGGGSLLFVYEKGFYGARSGEAGGRPQREEAYGPHGSLIDMSGKVVDVFGNPREDVVVIVRGLQWYGMTDEKGRYYLTGVPFQKTLALDAYYGAERDSMSVELDALSQESGRAFSVPEPMVLNPIALEAVLCMGVERDEENGLRPIGVFAGEVPRIPYGVLAKAVLPDTDEDEGFREVWCFVKVFGPDRYEVGRSTELIFEWHFGGKPQDAPYVQSVGVRSFGWRSRVSKRVWVGEWTLRIATRRLELARIDFEIY